MEYFISLMSSDKDTQIKRRGRPRKNMSVSKNADKINIKEVSAANREIILHMPLLFNRKTKYVDENAFTYDGTTENNYEDEKEAICDISSDGSDICDLDISDNSDNDSDVRNDKIDPKDKIINDLKAKLAVYESHKESEYPKSNQCHTTFGNNSIVIPMSLKLIDNSSNGEITCAKTNLCCWRCTEQFDNVPCFMPEKYQNGTFYVFGVFCSWNCVVGFNIELNDYLTMFRYGLIKLLRYEMTGEMSDIVPSHPRYCLQKFGGHLSTSEYRSTFLSHEYRLILPPMVNFIPCIEQKTKDYQCSKFTLSTNSAQKFAQSHIADDMADSFSFASASIKKKRK